GSDSADTIIGSSGNDSIFAFAGADIVNGGAGTDTIAMSGTSVDLNAAANSNITNIEAVSAASATAGVSIDLHNPTQAFAVTGTGFAGKITSPPAAAHFNAGLGDGLIFDFVGADTVNGGAGIDMIGLPGTSTALNAASNTQIVGVEAVSAATAAGGVTIDLHNQADGFAITGSEFVDSLIGS